MTQERKDELRQLLHEAIANLEIRIDPAKKPQWPPIINVDVYRQILQQYWIHHSSDFLSPVMLYELYIVNEATKSKLLDFIRGEFASIIHEDWIQPASFFIGGGLSHYSLDHLLKQLLKITIAFGEEWAISDFDRCAKNTSGSFQYMALLEGIKIEQETQIFEGIQIVPLPTSTSELPHYLPSNFLISHTPVNFMGKTLLIINASISPIFSKPPSEMFQEEFRMEHLPFQVEVTGGKFSNFNESHFYEKFCQALSLVCNSAVQISLQWKFLANHELFNLSSFAINGVSYRTDVNPGQDTIAGKAEIDEAKCLYQNLVKLDPKVREKLQIPIDRWIKSKADGNPVDKMLDLGIAFESLFLPSDSIDQLSFQFRLRASWHLGKNKTDRKELMDEFKAIYTLRSQAAHNGELPERIKIRKGESVPTAEFIPRAQSVCLKSIKKILEDGKIPDWESLVLGE